MRHRAPCGLEEKHHLHESNHCVIRLSLLPVTVACLECQIRRLGDQLWPRHEMDSNLDVIGYGE